MIKLPSKPFSIHIHLDIGVICSCKMYKALHFIKEIMLFHLVILFCLYRCSMLQNFALPVEIEPVLVSNTIPGACPSAESINVKTNAMLQEIRNIIQNVVNPELANRRRCPCGGPGRWTKIASLNMSDPSQDCPSNWRLITSPVRACGRSLRARVPGCDSAIFPSNGRSYSHVCGRVIAFHSGTPNAFNRSINENPGLEGAYIDGVSLTHGAAGSRQHVWSFPASIYETDPSYVTEWNCPCTNTNVTWPHQVPLFVGNNYFCDTGNPGPGFRTNIIYSNDPLWDGEGCGPTNACCQFNSPPWFCTKLPQPTSDDIELRICADQNTGNEDVLVNLIDISIM